MVQLKMWLWIGEQWGGMWEESEEEKVGWKWCNYKSNDLSHKSKSISEKIRQAGNFTRDSHPRRCFLCWGSGSCVDSLWLDSWGGRPTFIFPVHWAHTAQMFILLASRASLLFFLLYRSFQEPSKMMQHCVLLRALFWNLFYSCFLTLSMWAFVSLLWPP